jgi:cytoskeletal protein RodZ
MSLTEVGLKLKTAREGKGLTLRQIYERTKIPIDHLEAIDNGNNENLPEPVYVAGFIKRYSQCVGLDGDLLAMDYREDSYAKEHEKQKAFSHQMAPVYVKSHDFNAIKINNKPPTYKTFLFPFLLIIIILSGVAWFAKEQANNGIADPNIASLKETTSHLSTQTDTKQQNNKTDPTAESTKEQTNIPKQLSLSANQHVWVEVKAISSGENLFNGFLEQGERRDFQDSEGLRIIAGNGGSISVDFRGKIESFGTPGQRTERAFVFQNPQTIGEASSDKTTATTNSANTSSDTTKPTKTTKERVADSQPSKAKGSSRRPYDDISSRRYIPGESLGSTRSIDVPYRYTDDNLDTN